MTKADQKAEYLKRELNSPFINGKALKSILTGIYGISEAQTRALYRSMRTNADRQLKEMGLIGFSYAVPAKIAFDYLSLLGISKEKIIEDIDRMSEAEDSVNN